jgi:hypothetical protein
MLDAPATPEAILKAVGPFDAAAALAKDRRPSESRPV